MPLYEYAGKHPEIPPDGEGVARPGEIRLFVKAGPDGELIESGPPDWGLWRELSAEEAAALTAEPEEPAWRREPAAAPEPDDSTDRAPDSEKAKPASDSTKTKVKAGTSADSEGA